MITDKQVSLLFSAINQGYTMEAAAAKAKMSEKTARKYIKTGRFPSKSKRDRNYRTRKVPFESVWPEIENILKSNKFANTKALFEYIQKKHPEQYHSGQLRTLQRQIKKWKSA